MIRSLHSLHRLIEEAILLWALRELNPTSPVVPKIVHRLADWERAPSPLDPADSIVTGFCIVATLAMGAISLFYGLPGETR